MDRTSFDPQKAVSMTESAIGRGEAPSPRLPGGPEFRHPAGMRFVHCSDWHLGRLFHGRHLTEDQAHVLLGEGQLLDLCRDAKAEALVVAGDLYDRAVPPSEAVELLSETLERVARDLKIPALLIAGNHDSPERIGFGAALMESSGIHLAGPVRAEPARVVLEDAHGTVSFHLLPYAEPAVARHELEEPDLQGHDAVLRALAGRARAQAEARSVLVAHAFVTGGEESESERPLSIGGADRVDAEAFEGFSYVALGHLHRPQRAGAERLRYSGSLLKYSFSEADQRKSVSVVELDAAGELSVEQVELSPRRDVRVIQGRLEKLLEGPAAGENREDYLLARLEDREALLDPMGKLREVYPNVLHLERAGREGEGLAGAPRVDRRGQGDAELFESFVREVTDEDPSDEERAAFLEVAERLRRGERES